MPVTLTVKKVPDRLAARLRRRAAAHHQSLQRELMAVLEEAASPARLTVEEMHLLAKRLGPPTLGDSVRMIREDRDAR
ncbi:MAG: FitA-like ribbon-helix-helix domain-containing protein [Candidatus Binataceae bacterium]